MVDPANMLAGRTRETKIRRDAEGRWFNDGVEITHPLLREAFDAWLCRAPDGSGRYCLSNDINWAYVEIEGPPRFVRGVSVEGDRVALRLSDGRVVALDPRTLRQGRDGALYCDVGEGLSARFERHAVMQLAELLGEDDAGVYLRVGGELVRPPVVDDPLAAG
ncbi:MAG TPA: hypothetical protein VIL20_06285 [Sandaracinaceae bacterium]